MKKIYLLLAILSSSLAVMATDEVYDVNFALASKGSSAVATSGNAALAIDGNEGTRWESATTDDETWTLDMGQVRTFNTIRIYWEGAFAKQFTISISTDSVTWADYYVETNLTQAGWQTIYKDSSYTARYVKYHGTERATQWGQSFYEFQVMLADAPRVNLALSTNILTDNKVIAQSAFAPNGTDAFHAVDGNAGSVWQGSATNGTAEDEASRTFDAWFVVDLRDFYTIDKICIQFEGACSQAYHIDFGVDTTNWNLGYNYVGNAGVNGHTDVITTALDNNQKVRYVRFWSTKAATQWGMKIFEFEVYGNDWVDSGDDEAPVMVSATLDSKTASSAVIAVSATDNVGVTKFHVVDAAHEINVRCTPVNGKITVSSLTPETAYNFTITAIDAAQNESANSMAVAVTTSAYAEVPDTAAPAPTWPAKQVKAIYSPTYEADCVFAEWGSGTTCTQDTYGKNFVMNGNGYFGMEGFNFSCVNMEKLHYDIWIADDATMRIVPICRNAADNGNEPEVGATVSLHGQQWNSIDLSLATDYAAVTNWNNVYQVKIDQAANLTIWVGNAYFYRETAIVDTVAPTNAQAAVASQSYFSVVLSVSAEDDLGVLNYVVMDGEQEMAVGAGNSGETVNITVAGLQANTSYNFTVIAKDDADNAAAPVAVQASTLAAPAPAEAPTYAADKVLAIQTDVYNNIAYTIQDWWAMPAVSAGQLSASSKALCIEPNTTASSCFGIAFAATDITAYDALEMDVYATTANSALDIQVIGIGEAATTYSLVADQWNHIVLNIKGNTKNNCEQVGFYNCDKLTGTCFVQNVLFVKAAEQGIEDVVTGVKAQKVFENRQLVIIKNGVRYNVAGQVVR